MKKQLLVSILFLCTTVIVANPETKANELCDCLKQAKASDKTSDKKKCLSQREKHVKALKKGSKSYESYLNALQKCEQELAGSTEINPNLTTKEKTSVICDCFQKAEKQNSMTCFKLQSDYGKTIADPEEKKQFNLSSGSCN
ncbi:hypothetical protein [Leptospira perdikensis]|uniref:Cys-rich protein n=1 Tax=Leptospira perdikensis TaxID=2484948 RepID=A0A4R9JKK1_9LEPT|nr:hypothetical protein [Leptospira perdikensis]TGL44604.1 hypothetical protein EHQ49_03780 [Leptospira perdikensis]